MVLDGIVIVFLLLGAYSGYKKGLTTILISLIGFVVAIILAFTLKSTLVDFVVEKTDVDTFMHQIIDEGIDKAIQSKVDESSESKKDSFYVGIVKNMAEGETVENLSNNVVNFILETAAFIFIFLIVTTCAFILKMMLNIVFDLPILSSINNIGGLGMGFVMALFKLWIILAIVSMIVPMFGGLKVLIDSSNITKMLYNTNILVKILSSGLKF